MFTSAGIEMDEFNGSRMQRQRSKSIIGESSEILSLSIYPFVPNDLPPMFALTGRFAEIWMNSIQLTAGTLLSSIFPCWRHDRSCSVESNRPTCACVRAYVRVCVYFEIQLVIRVALTLCVSLQLSAIHHRTESKTSYLCSFRHSLHAKRMLVVFSLVESKTTSWDLHINQNQNKSAGESIQYSDNSGYRKRRHKREHATQSIERKLLFAKNMEIN